MAEGRTDGADDARAAAIIRRMRLFFGLSFGVMLLGFVLMGVVLVYRAIRPAAPAGPPVAAAPAAAPVAAPLVHTLALPAGARLVQTTADGPHLYLTVQTPGGAQSVYAFDAETLAYRGRIDLAPAR
jgi:hypothetical protein